MMLIARAAIRISGFDFFSWPTLAVIAVFAGGRWLLGRQDRQMIRENLEEHRCKVRAIEWNPSTSLLLGRNARSYRVVYETPSGKRMTGVCIASLLLGIKWISDGPRGSPSGFPAEDSECTCLSCGAVMPAKVKRCKKCGWSYTE
jgi:hypothetical protein